METAGKILRSSIHAFLQNYHPLTSLATMIAFPFSASLLLSQSLSSPHLLLTIQHRFHSLFTAASFPSSSTSFLSLKLSQTLFATILTLPFSLTFLLLTKASVIKILHSHPPLLFSSLLRLYRPLLHTHLCNSFLLLSANAAVFSILFLSITFFDVLGVSSSHITYPCLSIAAGTILYSVVLANALVVCNLALIISGVDNSGGYVPILKALLLVKGRVATGLSLALPTGVLMAAVEALFQYRVVKQYNGMGNRFSAPLMWEAFAIGYIYSILVVLEIVASCMFYTSCKLDGRGGFRVMELLELGEGGGDTFVSLKSKETP